MSAAEVNFTFNGLHCLRDFGCVFIGESSRVVSPETAWDEYEIAGVSGTVLLGNRPIAQPFELKGVLVPMKSPGSLQAGQQLARSIAAWLKSGRHELCWDYEPMHCYEAEVVEAIHWDTKAWMDGGIAIAFRVQPYARELTPTVARAELRAGSEALLVPVYTAAPCPVDLEIENAGSSAITSIVIADPRGHTVDLSKNLSLMPGETLKISMEPPIGAAIHSGGEVRSALMHAVKFDQLLLEGPEALTITLSYPAIVTATARGRLL